MKKTLSFILAALMILSVFPLFAFADVRTNITSVNFGLTKKLNVGDSLEKLSLVQQGSKPGMIMLHPNWEISRVSYSTNGAAASLFAPTVEEDKQYSMVFFVYPKDGYTFSDSGTYKLNGTAMTKRVLSGNSASELAVNEYAIVTLDEFSYICFRVGYKYVSFDSQPYGVLLRGYDHTISGDMSKGHITSCSYSTLVGGGSLTCDYTSVTLAKEKLNATGNYVYIYPNYSNHSYGAFAVTEPTETAEGQKERVCSVCDYHDTYKIPSKAEVRMEFNVPKEGDPIPVDQNVTLTNPGYKAVSTSWYNATDNVSATGKFTGGKTYTLHVDIAAENGYDISDLDYLNVYVIDRFVGSAPFTSSINGRIFQIEYTFTFEHAWDSGKVTKEPTCVAKGTKTFTCTGCKATKTEDIAATGEHNYVIKDSENDIYAATLTSSGSITYTCSVCGKTYKENIAPVTNISVSKTKFVYNGKNQKPTVSVIDSENNPVEKTHYSLVYSKSASKAPGKYTVTVKAGDKEDERSGWNYFFTKSFTYTIAPRQVKGLKVSKVAKTSIKLTWTKRSEAKYYQVYRSTDGKKWTKAATVSTNSATIKNLKAGTKYQFKVRAVDSSKKVTGKFSSVVKTGTLTAAPKISKLTSTKAKTATVTWAKVTGAKSYTVYKSTNGKDWTVAKSGVTKLTYKLTGLTGGKKIYVKVIALNAFDKKSAASEVKSVKVKK